MNQSENERLPKAGDDLLWTAYQYTADELPEPAARAFEGLLEADQGAREALAEAVALGDTIRAALEHSESVSAGAVMPASLAVAGGADPAIDRRASCGGASCGGTSYGGGSYGWAAAWVALGAAACLALTMALRSVPQADAPIAERPAAKNEAIGKIDAAADQQLLAVLFPEESSEFGVGDSASNNSVSGDSGSMADTTQPGDAVPPGFDYDDAPFEPMPEASAPDWLIAAVAESGVSVNE